MSSGTISPMRKVLLEALVLCVFAAAVGVSLNFQLIFKAFSGGNVVIQKVPVVEDTTITTEHNDVITALPFPVLLEDLELLLESGALFVDARSRTSYLDGHLDGAISLPFATVAQGLTQFKQQVSLSRTLIVYCSGYGCLDSFDLGVVLLEAGYAEVLVYEGGVPEWQAAGRPMQGVEE